jgi:hypothetical protein
MPHSVVRLYSDSGPLVARLRESEAEVRAIMHSVPGFLTYGIMDTGGGAISVTTCEDKAGTDESIARAAEWIKTNLPEAKIAPPRIIEGEGIFRFQAEGIQPGGHAHLAVRIFSDAAPPGLRQREAEVRELMTAVSGFRSYTVVDTGSGGVTIIAGEDKDATDEVSRRMREFVQAQYPDFTRTPPQVIEAEGVFRFDAQAAPA